MNAYTEAGVKLYKVIDGVPDTAFLIEGVPATFTLNDLRKPDWPKIRFSMIENIINLYVDSLKQIEDDYAEVKE